MSQEFDGHNTDNKDVHIDPDFWDDPEDALIRAAYFDKPAPSDDTPQLVKRVSGLVGTAKSKIKTKQKEIVAATQKQKRPEQDQHTLQELSTRLQLRNQERLEERKSASTSMTRGSALPKSVDGVSSYTPPKRFNDIAGGKKQRGIHMATLGGGFARAADLVKQLPLQRIRQHAVKLLRMSHAVVGRTRKRYIAIAVGGVLLLALSIRTLTLTRSRIQNPDKKGTSSQNKDVQSVQGVAVQKPDFTVLSPGNSSTTKTQERFDPSRKVASFQDQLKGSLVIVSQQQLPEKTVSDPQFLSKMAEGMYLKQRIETNKSTAYIGTSVEKGMQTVAFVYDRLLVLIKSDKTHADKDWVDYINDLH